MKRACKILHRDNELGVTLEQINVNDTESYVWLYMDNGVHVPLETQYGEFHEAFSRFYSDKDWHVIEHKFGKEFDALPDSHLD